MRYLRAFLPALFLAVLASPLASTADTITVGLGGLVPIGSCTPSAGTTCVGPTSMSTSVGSPPLTLTMSGLRAGSPAPLGVTVDNVISPPILYVGVTGGNNQDEIDVQPQPPGQMEMLSVTFSTPVIVQSIDISKLFLQGVRNDLPDEWGRVCGYLNGSLVGCVDFQGTQTGRLTLTALFGGQWVNELHFVPLPTSTSTSAINSDYGVASITLTSVPEPGTLALLGSGLATLAFRYRRRRRKPFPDNV